MKIRFRSLWRQFVISYGLEMQLYFYSGENVEARSSAKPKLFLKVKSIRVELF